MPFIKRITEQLQPKAPFDFVKTLDYLRRFPPPALDQAVAENSFVKAFRIYGQTVAALVYISNVPNKDQPCLQYELYADKGVDADLKQAFEQRLKSFLGLDDDLRGFYAKAKSDPGFNPIVESLFGYHPVRFPSPFESAVWAILSQRNRMSIARNMYRALVQAFGHQAEADGIPCWAFPEPHELAGRDEGDLAFVARNLRRGEYLIDAARAFALAPPDFLVNGEHWEVEEWLRGIKGIGPWSASFILWRGLGRGETIPLPDRGFIDAASRVYGAGATLGNSDLMRIAQRYHPWQGYWAHYLRVGA